MSQKVRTFLWFESRAEEAARLYASLFDQSEIIAVHRFPSDPAVVGEVMTVEFTLSGAVFVAMNAQGGPKPNEAFSFSVSCKDQSEVDRLWESLVDGGAPIQCGWLRDKFGFSWQIVPTRFYELLEMGSPSQRAAVMAAMMRMQKFDVAALEQAFGAAE